MLERPNWRYNLKSKWRDSKQHGFVPSYRDFGRKTTNGFHTIKHGSIRESDGAPIKHLEKYNPYINGLHEIGHKFRSRMPHKDVSQSEFSTHTSNDIIMKKSTFNSSSIRSIESQSLLQLAKEKFKKLTNVRYGGNFEIKMDYNTINSDYDFNSPKVKGSKKGTSGRYKLNVNRSNSLSFKNDLPLIRASTKTLGVDLLR